MRSFRWLALLHLVTNGLLISLGYYWLGVGESRASTLVWSACVALFIVGLSCAAYGAALVYFQKQAAHRTRVAWWTALRNLLALVAAALIVATIYWLLNHWDGYSAQPAFQIASYLTLKSRMPVRPSSVARIFNIALWLVRWAVLPVLLLPMIAAVAARGWIGFRRIGVYGRRWLYWIQAPALLLSAFWIPLRLLGWTPHVNSFGMEALSFTMRAIAAYLLLAGSWLVLAFVTSRGIPRVTQPSTVVSP